MKKRKMNNKGFSIVELIVVIAIMAVLVGVLAPHFIKYVENSRRSTDIQNGQAIASAIKAGIADGTLKNDVTAITALAGSTTATALRNANLLAEVPAVKASALSSQSFAITYSVSSGAVYVYVGTTTANQVYPTTAGEYAQ